MQPNYFRIAGTIEEMSMEERGINKDSKQFVKRQFVVKTNDKYPMSVSFVAMNSKVDDLSFYHPGSEIIVNFRIEVSNYQGKNYNNIRIIGFGGTVKA